MLEVAVATKNLEDKYKKVNDKLTSKIKEHKKSEARGKKRLNTILEKNKKIAELETATTRLNLMKEHHRLVLAQEEVSACSIELRQNMARAGMLTRLETHRDNKDKNGVQG